MAIYLNEDTSPVSYEFNPALYMSEGDGSVWWDFGDITTMFRDIAMTQPVTTTGQTVAVVLDKGPNGYKLIQPTAGNRPVYTVSGAQKFLRFTAANVHHLVTENDADLGLAACHGFSVFSNSATTDYMRIMSIGATAINNDVTGNGCLGLMSGPASQHFNFRGMAAAMDASIAGTGATPLALYEWEINGANSAKAYKAGVAGSVDSSHAAPNARTNGKVVIGTMSSFNAPSTTSPLSGDVYGIMHMTRSLTNGEVAAIRQWWDDFRY